MDAHVEVQQDYLAAYRVLLTQLHECGQMGMLTAQMSAQGDLFPGQRMDAATPTLVDAFGTNVRSGVVVQDPV